MALTPAPAIVPSTLFIALPRLVARRAPHVDTDTAVSYTHLTLPTNREV